METNRAKISLFLGLTFLISIFLGKVAGLFFLAKFFDFLENFLDFLLNVLFLLMFVGLSFSLPALFLTTKRLLFSAISLNSLGFLIGILFLIGFQNLATILFLTILFFTFQYLFFKGVQERAKRFVSFSPLEIFPLKVTHFLLSLSLVFSLSFYFALQDEVSKEKPLISRKLSEKLSQQVTPIFQKSLEESLKTKMGGKT